MEPKKLIWMGVLIGTTVGGALPLLWGNSAFSFSLVVLAAVGGILGIWGGLKLSKM